MWSFQLFLQQAKLHHPVLLQPTMTVVIRYHNYISNTQPTCHDNGILSETFLKGQCCLFECIWERGKDRWLSLPHRYSTSPRETLISVVSPIESTLTLYLSKYTWYKKCYGHCCISPRQRWEVQSSLCHRWLPLGGHFKQSNCWKVTGNSSNKVWIIAYYSE